jgi:hypothetical protein
MSDITEIERALGQRLEQVGAQLEALENERDRLRRALRDEQPPEVACPAQVGHRSRTRRPGSPIASGAELAQAARLPNAWRWLVRPRSAVA